ncbi:MAG: SfnB family sulfur acquisition oxidoreductase [Sulfurifustaceae bacterium]
MEHPTSSVNTSVTILIDDETPPDETVNPAVRRIGTDAEAIDVARQMAVEFAPGAAERDRDRKLPYDEVAKFSASGLWAITVPKRWGGPGVSNRTLGEVLATIAAADPNIAQIPKNHFLAVDIIALNGADAQRRFFFDEVLCGKRIGHAASERGTKNVLEIRTRLTSTSGRLVLNGEKFYSTGALFADWVAVSAIDDHGRFVQVFVPRNAPGLTVLDDWTGFGQRITASGTVKLENVVVDPAHVMSLQGAYDRPTLAGPASQFQHACIDLGMARAAIREAIEFVNTKTRPWADSGLKRACEDPYIISAIGDLQIRLFAAEAGIEKAAKRLDETPADPNEDEVARASIDVASAKVLTTELAIFATNKMFELAGASATLASYNLDRHWRNARTHTLHDPVRWKYAVVGDYYLNSVNPRRHNYI